MSWNQPNLSKLFFPITCNCWRKTIAASNLRKIILLDVFFEAQRRSVSYKIIIFLVLFPVNSKKRNILDSRKNWASASRTSRLWRASERLKSLFFGVSTPDHCSYLCAYPVKTKVVHWEQQFGRSVSEGWLLRCRNVVGSPNICKLIVSTLFQNKDPQQNGFDGKMIRHATPLF